MKDRRTYRSSQEDFEKYLQDEMVLKDTHAFEKATLDDAFEQEALEGWESQSVENAKKDLALLRKRLADRSRKPFPIWQVAAAVALLVVGTFITYQALETGQDVIALQEEKSNPIEAEQTEVTANAPPALKETEPSLAESKPEPVEQPVAESVADEESTIALTQDDGAVATIEKFSNKPTAEILEPQLAEVAEDDNAQNESIALADQAVSEAAAFQVTEEELADVLFADEEDFVPESTYLRPVTAAQPIIPDSLLIKGVVFDPYNRVVSNVDVVVDGTELRTKSGIDGKYELKVPENMSDKVIRYEHSGFTAEERSVATSEELNIQLQANLVASEEAAADREVRKRVSTTGAVSRAAAPAQAEPEGGYDEYLQRLRAIIEEEYSDRNLTAGIVRVQATVEVDGTLEDLQILKGLDEETNNVALEVLGKGPKWRPILENGRPAASPVEILIPFQ